MVGVRPAPFKKRALQFIQLVATVGRPLAGRNEAPAPVKVAVVATAMLPLLRRIAQMTVEPSALKVVVEPRTKSGPLPQKCLVGDLDHAVRGTSAACGR